MNPPLSKVEKILDAFKRNKILNKAELLNACGCSLMTLWRILHKEGYFTSYNYNAKYYTLATIAQFDDYGLWACQDVRFSQWGALPKTIIGIVEQSSQGMTAQELEDLLHVPNVKPLLPKLINNGELRRESLNGAFVYLPAAQKNYEQQFRHRMDSIKPPQMPEPQQIIALLVEMVQHPEQTPRQWARRLARKNMRLGVDDIRAVMDRYHLTVKKTLSNS
jgi:hypothetical protein